MADSIIQTLIDMDYSPTAFQEYQYSRLESLMNGEVDLVDATNPFVFTLEMGSELSAGLVGRIGQAVSKTNKAAAESWDDLYRHMADVDYLNLFSGYSIGNFYLQLSKEEIIAKAVKVGETGVRKLIIPKYTTIKIAGIPFMTLYPIEIRVMSHGGLQIVYDGSIESVIKPLETNIIEWKEQVLLDTRMVALPLAMVQLARREYYDTLNPTVGFSKTYVHEDEFYYCEVFGVDANNVETPYVVTHSEIIYDRRVKTALLSKTEAGIKVTIPRIYFSEKNYDPQIKVVIYTSKGEVNLDMGDYVSNAFSLEFGQGFTEETDSKYYTPFESWEVMGVVGNGTVNGGHFGLTFEQARRRAIINANRTNRPITEMQLEGNLEIDGFTVVSSIDNLSRRIYHATRHLPAVAQSAFTTGAACMIGMVQSNLEDLAKHGSVKDNGLRLTLTPEVLYKASNGVIEVVPSFSNPLLLGLSSDALVTHINSNEYMYSPFHYVLDATNNSFDCRAYFLDAPTIESRQFIFENDTTQLRVSSNRMSFTRSGTDWILLVEVVSGDMYQEIPLEQLFCQLSFVPELENKLVFLNGVIDSVTEDGNAIWKFVLGSTLDIDNEHRIQLKGFSMFSDQERTFPSPLEQDFNLIFGVSDYNIFELEKSEIDLNLGNHLLPDDVVGITHETVRLKLGEALTQLWSNGRTVVSSVKYQTYGEDIPYTHPNTLYVEDPVTGFPKVWTENGELKYEIIVRKGDPVVNEDGQIELKHRATDVVYDDNNMPIVVKPRETERQFELFFVDGAYYFSTTASDQAYRSTIPSTVLGFINDKLKAMSPVMLNRTLLYFYPKKSLGHNKVIVSNGKVIEIPARLDFTVVYYMNKLNYSNLELRKSITQVTKRIINEALKAATVSVSGITELLKAAVRDDVMSIEITPMGPDKDLSTFTANDDATRCSVRRNLKVLSNGSLGIEEAIVVDFVPHKE